MQAVLHQPTRTEQSGVQALQWKDEGHAGLTDTQQP